MYIADLHIHSRYSRATSKEGTPEQLDFWARRKGIQILGTGDFTHPAWRSELEEKLTPAEEGLYTLKEEYRLPGGGEERTRFVVSGEISSIYKKNGKVRKVHSVILLPSLEDADLLSKKLEAIGNIHSDGRPILGLDCRDLLEITLELCPRAIYIPAHIWTPHFSLFGAFSGFDTIEECFEDLTPQIHALETGLSSDPPMNWRLSALDPYQMVSNSDAHSPAKLGREANLLDIQLSYEGLYGAIQEGNGLRGTIEFFPEEGKYHYDGHRKCHLCLSPVEAERYGGKCPVCGRKLTIGVEHRVEQLADRGEGFMKSGAKPFESLVPLPDVIAASTGHAAASSKVQLQYEQMIAKLGPEFPILREMPVEDIRRSFGSLIAEGIKRLREGRVERSPGYDGEYGTVKLFERWEIEDMDGQLSLFTGAQMAAMKEEAADMARAARDEKLSVASAGAAGASAASSISIAGSQVPLAGRERLNGLNEQQLQAVTAASRVTAVVAGPGTGKTKTLISRILYLLEERRVKPSQITAVTFTNKAAAQMRERLEEALGDKRTAGAIQIGTFHAICRKLLQAQGSAFTLADEAVMLEAAESVIGTYGLKIRPGKFLRQVSLWKTRVPSGETALKEGFQTGAPLEEAPAEDSLPLEALEAYQSYLKQEQVMDFDDLLLETLRLLRGEEGHTSPRAACRSASAQRACVTGCPQGHEIRKQRFAFLLVDEFQDISPVEYELIQAWNRGGTELFVIGDPDQSIYGFRGSDAACFERLKEDWPQTCEIRLVTNYRSVPSVVEGAAAVISHNAGEARILKPHLEAGAPVRLVTAPSEMSEAIFIAKEINRLVQGIDMLDSETRGGYGEERARGFEEIAVLYRTHRQAELLEMCLQKEGIPYVVTGRESYLGEKTVRGTLGFFKSILDPEDAAAKRLALKYLWDLPENVVSCGVYDAMREKYAPMMKRGKPPKVLEAWMEDMNLQEDPALGKFSGISVFYKNMAELMEGLLMGGEGDLRRCGGKAYVSEAVSLMTLHGSKGLEFPVVLLYGAREGVVPLDNGKQVEDIEEERRLFFVGMTRAKEELVLTTSGKPSPFMGELPEEVICREDAGRQKDLDGAKQLSLFDFMKG